VAVAQSRSPIDGIWEYMNPGVRGQAYIFNGHYVFFWSGADSIRSMLPTGPLPDSLRAKLYSTLLLDAGTYTVSDTVVTARTEHSKDPREVGVTFRWSFVTKGDTITYHILDAAGQTIGTGKARRIQSFR
jgi:hypothetical protein